jgi:hypothetical protein
MKNLERRLAAAEQRLTPRSAPPRVIEIRGGLDNGDPTLATAGAKIWERAPDESFTAFRWRVITEATAAAERFVVIGGLPTLGDCQWFFAG